MKQERIAISHAIQATVNCPHWLQTDMRANLTKAQKGKVNPMRADIAKMLSKHPESKCEPVTAKASVEPGVMTPLAEGIHWQQVARTGESIVHNIVRVIDMPSQSKYEKQKLSQKHLSSLMKFILLNADGGIQRGEIAERFYGLERRYSGYYTDPCLRGKQKSRYDRQCRRAQPAISKVLRRLEKRGLVRLIRRGRYVKEVCLIERGKAISNVLVNPDNSKKSNGT